MQRHQLRAAILAVLMLTSVVAGVGFGPGAVAADTDDENWAPTESEYTIPDEQWGQSFAVYEDTLYVGGGSGDAIYELDEQFDVASETSLAVEPAGLTRFADQWVVASGEDGTIYTYDDEFDTRETVIDGGFTDTQYDEAPWNIDTHDGQLYVADGSEVVVYDETFTEVDRIGVPADITIGLHVAGDAMWLTDSGGTTVYETTLEGEVVATHDIGDTLEAEANGLGLYDGHWYVGDLLESEQLYEFHADIDRSATVTGTVTDQDGQPVPNATVAAVGVLEGGLEADPDDLDAEAAALLDDLEDPLPDAFEGDYDLESHTEVDGTYALVHAASDWGVGTTHIADSSVESPRLSVPAGESVVLSVWDGRADGGLLENQVDGSFPGATTSGEIRLEQLAGSGDTLADRTYETQPYATTTGVNPLTERDHHAVETRLPVGVYRVTPDGGAGYVFTVGEPGDIGAAIADDMRNEADQLTDRAERVRGLVADETLVRETARTDGDGTFELSVDERAVTVQLEAMRADGAVLEGVSEPSLEDLREARLSGYNGSVYLPAPDGQRVDVPASGVDVSVYRAPDVPAGDIDSFGDLQAFLDDQRVVETVGELQRVYGERLAEMERTQLESVYTTHRELVTTVPDAEAKYLERSSRETVADADGLSNAELEIETEHMQRALASAGTVDPPALEDGIDLADGELSLEYPVPDGLVAESVAVEVHYADGSVETVEIGDGDIEAGGWLEADRVVLESVPVDGEVLDVRLVGAGAGGVLDDRIPVGETGIEAVQFGTLAPGPDERVAVGIEGGDLRSVDVRGPDGASVAVSDGGAAFYTDGTGVYDVQATVRTDAGQRVIRESVRALEHSRSDPATVRVGGDGAYAVVGEVLESARIERERGTTSVTAIVGGETTVGSLHVKPDAAVDTRDHDLEVSVVQGSAESQYSSHVEVVAHFDSYDEGTIAWRDDDAVLMGGGTRYGEVVRPDSGEKAVVRTYTDSDGTVTIRTVENPDALDRLAHWADRVLPTVSWPLEVGGFVGEKAIGEGEF